MCIIAELTDWIRRADRLTRWKRALAGTRPRHRGDGHGSPGVVTKKFEAATPRIAPSEGEGSVRSAERAACTKRRGSPPRRSRPPCRT